MAARKMKNLKYSAGSRDTDELDFDEENEELFREFGGMFIILMLSMLYCNYFELALLMHLL